MIVGKAVRRGIEFLLNMYIKRLLSTNYLQLKGSVSSFYFNGGNEIRVPKVNL